MIRVKNLRVPYDDVRPLAEIAAERLNVSPCAHVGGEDCQLHGSTR